MSKDKHKGVKRCLELLKQASHQFGLMFNHEGGMSMFNRDVQKLINAGLIVIKRMDYNGLPMPQKHTARFISEIFGQHLHGRTVRTFGVLTEKGADYLEKMKEK